MTVRVIIVMNAARRIRQRLRTARAQHVPVRAAVGVRVNVRAMAVGKPARHGQWRIRLWKERIVSRRSVRPSASGGPLVGHASMSPSASPWSSRCRLTSS